MSTLYGKPSVFDCPCVAVPVVLGGGEACSPVAGQGPRRPVAVHPGGARTHKRRSGANPSRAGRSGCAGRGRLFPRTCVLKIPACSSAFVSGGSVGRDAGARSSREPRRCSPGSAARCWAARVAACRTARSAGQQRAEPCAPASLRRSERERPTSTTVGRCSVPSVGTGCATIATSRSSSWGWRERSAGWSSSRCALRIWSGCLRACGSRCAGLRLIRRHKVPSLPSRTAGVSCRLTWLRLGWRRD